MRPLGPYGVIGASLYGDLWDEQVPGVVPAENESGSLGTLFIPKDKNRYLRKAIVVLIVAFLASNQKVRGQNPSIAPLI